MVTTMDFRRPPVFVSGEAPPNELPFTAPIQLPVPRPAATPRIPDQTAFRARNPFRFGVTPQAQGQGQNFNQLAQMALNLGRSRPISPAATPATMQRPTLGGSIDPDTLRIMQALLRA